MLLIYETLKLYLIEILAINIPRLKKKKRILLEKKNFQNILNETEISYSYFSGKDNFVIFYVLLKKNTKWEILMMSCK